MAYKFSKRSLERLEGVDERMVRVIKKALTISRIDFGIPESGGLRTAREQRLLYLAKKSNADGVEHKSRHQSGEAIDVYAYIDGKASWEPEHLTHIATAVLQAAIYLDVPVKWGGLWKNFVDMPHFERIV